MKTTVEIPDTLLEQARQVAASEGSTVRALIEEGLRRVLRERQEQGIGFRLRKVGMAGEGLHPHVADASWDVIRGMIYEGQGG
jgi:hypothetical protein